jgi:hypothetical protein
MLDSLSLPPVAPSRRFRPKALAGPAWLLVVLFAGLDVGCITAGAGGPATTNGNGDAVGGKGGDIIFILDPNPNAPNSGVGQRVCSTPYGACPMADMTPPGNPCACAATGGWIQGVVQQW